jgi:hypothetical protein
LQETEEEGRKLYGENYLGLRYEDLLAAPFDELTRLWKFLGVKKINKSLEKEIKIELSSNPDEEWQSQRNEGIASFLPKGQAGNWTRLFTARDKALFEGVRGRVMKAFIRAGRNAADRSSLRRPRV